MAKSILILAFTAALHLATVSSETSPYLVSIMAPGYRGRQHVCNGAIINKNWILTTANCVAHFEDPHAFTVRTTDSNVDDTSIGRKEFHPLYTVGNVEYNVALLRVQNAIELNDQVKAIETEASNLPIRANQNGLLIGWGYSYANERSEELIINSLDVMTVEKLNCAASDDENKLCVRIVTDPVPSGACNGAAGSLFVIDNKLTAIASYGVGCEPESEQPQILTPINADINDWITVTTQE